MKILYVIPSLQKGGAERLAIDICREVTARREHKALLLVLSDNNQYSYQTKDLPIRKTSSSVSLSFLKKSKIDLLDFEKIITEFKPDIIHSHLFVAEIFSREITYPGVKYFTHCHDNMPQLRNLSVQTVFNKKLLTDFYEKQHLLKKYLKCNNKFIAISEHTKEYFESVLPSSLRKNVSLLNNAIDFKQFNVVNQRRSLDKIRIVNVGSFVEKKNQQFFIFIAEELQRRNLNVEIVLLGNGPLYAAIKKQIEQKGLQQTISMPGNVMQVEDYYAQANLYIHTAIYEPFGLVLLEAMASGLPVVSLDGGGNRGLVTDANGFMLYEQNAKLFADKVELLFNDVMLYNKLSEGAVAFARQFDIVSYTDKLLKLYEEN